MSNLKLNEILVNILNQGIVQSNEEGEICCPECNQDDLNIYIFTSVETYLKFAEAMGINESTSNCCVHLTASIETTLKYNEAVGQPTNINCPTNFNDCVNTLKTILDSEGIQTMMDKGIVEFGSLSGQSQVCRIYDFINLSRELDPSNQFTTSEILSNILDLGIVISCDPDNNLVIASVEEWLKWAEANGFTQAAAVPASIFTDDTITQSGDTPTVI
jgi:hypothetical protein